MPLAFLKLDIEKMWFLFHNKNYSAISTSSVCHHHNSEQICLQLAIKLNEPKGTSKNVKSLHQGTSASSHEIKSNAKLIY